MIALKELNPQYITDASGKKVSVVLSMAQFEELIEDLQDLAAVAERRDEPTIPHDEFMKELKQDGLI